MADYDRPTGEEILKELIEEIQATDPEMLAPKFKKEKGEQSLGTLTDETTKKVFSLSTFYRRESKRIQTDCEATGDSQEALNNTEFNSFKQKHETLQELFWYLLRQTIGIDISGIGIRDNWEVVSMPERSSGSVEIGIAQPPPFLRKLFEQN